MPTEDPLFGWFEHARHSESPAGGWHTRDGRLDYRTLYEQTQDLAAALLQDGLAPGEPLAAMCTDKQQLARAALLAIYLGCPLLPLRPGRPPVLPLLQTCGISRVLTDGSADHTGCHSLPLPAGPVGRADSIPRPRPLPGNRDQLLIATSGTSGPARITRHSGDGLCASVTASQAITGLGRQDLWLNCLPLHHIGGFAILLRCLHAAAGMLIEEDFDAGCIFNHLQASAVTHLSLVPAMLAQLLAAQGNIKLPATLRCVLVGGGPLPATLARQALAQGWPISVTWGMSETASHVTVCRVQDDWTPGKVGRPVDGCLLDIVDEQGHGVAGKGRIRVQGPMLMRGYCANSASHESGLDDGYFTTGDSGYLDARGNLHLCGRVDARLNSGGYNIDPEAVEALLYQCRGIEQEAVSATEDPAWGDLLLVLFSGPATEQAVVQWCRTHLDSWMRPRHALKTVRLPCTDSGKPDRPALARLAARLYAQRQASPDVSSLRETK